MNRILKLAALLGVFLAGINGARADVHEAVRKGQKVRLLPAAESAEPEKAPNILMTLLVGGEPVDLTQSWQLDIYPGDKASGKPAYSLSSRELAVSHKTSRCRPELVERMNRDAMSGQALFCNQSLEL
ncbi:MAG: hypothetical protein NDJ90_13870, partial [Oligoflexia bacterium]|nr:hypothetical protein [Oligoflexia bacterium]